MLLATVIATIEIALGFETVVGKIETDSAVVAVLGLAKVGVGKIEIAVVRKGFSVGMWVVESIDVGMLAGTALVGPILEVVVEVAASIATTGAEVAVVVWEIVEAIEVAERIGVGVVEVAGMGVLLFEVVVVVAVIVEAVAGVIAVI